MNAKLAQVSPISVGLMNGDYIKLVNGDNKPTKITRGVPPCRIGPAITGF